MMPKSPKERVAKMKPALSRGAACKTCRERKVRCDSVKPVCGTCKRSLLSRGIAETDMPHCLYVHKPRYDEEDITNIANMAALRESHGLNQPSEQTSIPSSSNLQIDDPSTSNQGDNERGGGEFTVGEKERVMILESRIERLEEIVRRRNAAAAALLQSGGASGSHLPPESAVRPSATFGFTPLSSMGAQIQTPVASPFFSSQLLGNRPPLPSQIESQSSQRTPHPRTTNSLEEEYNYLLQMAGGNPQVLEEDEEEYSERVKQ